MLIQLNYLSYHLLMPIFITVFHNNHFEDMSQPFWRAYYNDIDPEDPDNCNPLVRKLKIANLNIAENTIVGSGSHDGLGPFNIAGTCDGENFTFKLQYNDKELIFQGQRTNTCLEGDWSLQPDCPQGNFKFEFIVPKQGWNGHYCQFDTQHQMIFGHLNIETIPNGKVTGNGGDQNGDFVIAGEYDHTTNSVRFSKTYENQNSFKYWGTINGQTVKGHWGNKEGKPLGEFELYYVA